MLVPTATLATAERELAATSRPRRRRAAADLPAGRARRRAGDRRRVGRCWRRPSARWRRRATATSMPRRSCTACCIDANLALDDGEAILEWPDIDAEARRCSLFYTPLVAEWGTPAEQRLYDQALEAASAAAPPARRRGAGAAPRGDAFDRKGVVLPRPAGDGRRARLGGGARHRGRRRRARHQPARSGARHARPARRRSRVSHRCARWWRRSGTCSRARPSCGGRASIRVCR